MTRDDVVDEIRREAITCDSLSGAVEPLLDEIGNARLVLVGEATHGTHEFYRVRADLTKALITRKGFNLVVVEADWPDAYRVNRWVRHAGLRSRR
jgi:erythromycin esterase-like protein